MKKLAGAPDAQLGYEFGGFVLDPLRRQLRRLGDGTLVELTPRVFDALLYLVERPGQLLDREALFQALWPGMVVEDNNLSQTMSALRRALGDDQHDRYVLTVPRRGFRFVCPVRAVELSTEDGPAASVDVVAAPPGHAPAPTRARRHFVFAAVAAGVVVVAFLAWMQIRGDGDERASHRPVTTLAVLPFKPLLAEHRDEILELGMADSLIVRVSTAPGLVVRSIGSVRRFAGPDQDPIGQPGSSTRSGSSTAQCSDGVAGCG
jgi:DNA-binding winged helix-turn-helix (wHTH) protein